MKNRDYEKIKLKAGLEIHQQLDTDKKLFCKCSTGMKEDEVKKTIQRKQHPVMSELGEVDIASKHEHMKNMDFIYQLFDEETCLVDIDEEPPHKLNKNALKTAIEISLLFNCDIPDEIQVMRKAITDGSNPSAFQRTMVIGTNGWLKYNDKKIEINQICLEEDSAARVNTGKNKTIYRLNRLGIPLVEITTGTLTGLLPEEIQEIAYMIGLTCRSTGKVKHGIGSIRQDVNVSIKNDNRVEIKGVQNLKMLSKVVKLEVERQLKLDKVKEETRSTNEDGSTDFSRPLPGAARMYPETDILPICIDKKWIKDIEQRLPESLTDKLEKLKDEFKLPEDIANQLISSDYLELFEKITEKYPKVDNTVVANTFTSSLVELRRGGVEIDNLKEGHFMDVFKFLNKNRIVKESIIEILTHLSKNPNHSMSNTIKELGIELLSKKEIEKIVKDVFDENPDLSENKLYGITMSKVRGKSNPQEVKKIVKSVLKEKK